MKEQTNDTAAIERIREKHWLFCADKQVWPKSPAGTLPDGRMSLLGGYCRRRDRIAEGEGASTKH